MNLKNIAFIVLMAFLCIISEPSFAQNNNSVKENSKKIQVLDKPYVLHEFKDDSSLYIGGPLKTYRGNSEDLEAQTRYINFREHNLLLSVLNLENKKISTIKNPEIISVDFLPIQKDQKPRIDRFGEPCFSKDKIVQTVKVTLPSNKDLLIDAVLIRSHNGNSDLYTVNALTGVDPATVSSFEIQKNCKIFVNSYLQSGEVCNNLKSPLHCGEYEKADYRENVLNLKKTKSEHLKISLEDKNDWPLDVTVIFPDDKTKIISLPAGPFVRDSGFFKEISCFSCGCSCYQHATLFYQQSNFYLSVFGEKVDEDIRGIYKLDGKEWKQLVRLKAHAGDTKPSNNCYVVWSNSSGDNNKDNGNVSWINMCEIENE